jgi:hypothetical protein
METKIVGGTPQNTTFGQPGYEAIVDPTFGASRVRLMPSEFIAPQFQGGHYQVGLTASLGASVAANSALVSFRWGLSNGVALIKRIQLGWTLTTALTAVQLVDFDVIRATGWTASDTGGTASTPFVGNNNKKRSAIMNTSQLADLRITSGTALGAGTRTLDTTRFALLGQGPQPAANTVFSTGLALSDLYNESEVGEHPQIFGLNEGFVIRNITATPAAGAIQLYVVIKWAETPGL